MKNKKILVLTTTDNMIYQFLIPHIKHLTALGNQVECACAESGFWFKHLQDNEHFTMHKIDLTRNPLSLTNIKGYGKLKELQRQNNYDVIYCQQPVGCFLGRMLARKFNIQCIYTAHGFHFFKGCGLINKVVFKTAEKWAAKHTDILITMNEEDYQVAKTFNQKRLQGKVYKISGIGFDPKKYAEKDLTKAQAREKFGLKDDQFVIVTVAEFIKRKNYNAMLHTIELLKNENIKFLVCGRGKDEQQIKDMINSLGIQDKVEIMGYRKDINNIMQASDIFFLPSYQEGLTLSIIESLNFGLPIITSTARGNKDLVEIGKNGYVSFPDDSVGHANNILKLIKDNALLEKMSNHSKSMADEYSIKSVCDQLEQIYKNIK